MKLVSYHSSLTIYRQSWNRVSLIFCIENSASRLSLGSFRPANYDVSQSCGWRRVRCEIASFFSYARRSLDGLYSFSVSSSVPSPGMTLSSSSSSSPTPPSTAMYVLTAMRDVRVGMSCCFAAHFEGVSSMSARVGGGIWVD
jgi:hypothetical protein